MNRHHCSVVAICVALLVTGCGPPSAAPSADEKRQAGCVIGKDYPAPIVDHAWARERVLAAYRQSKEAA